MAHRPSGDNNITEAMERIRRDTCELAAALREVTYQSVAEIQDNLNRVAQGIRDIVETCYAQCARRTRQRPCASMLKWAGVGFLAGWLLGRRK